MRCGRAEVVQACITFDLLVRPLIDALLPSELPLVGTETGYGRASWHSTGARVCNSASGLLDYDWRLSTRRLSAEWTRLNRDGESCVVSRFSSPVGYCPSQGGSNHR